MSANTKIEWTDATVNWWAGCTPISPACDRCYAKLMAGRLWSVQWGPGQPRLQFNRAVETLRALDRKAERLGQKLSVFHNSLSDMFDNEVPDVWRMDAFQNMAETPNLIHLVLTKRIGNVGSYIQRDGLAFDLIGNGRVWLGATICNQEEADRDIPKLLAVPAPKRFLSMEPLLGPVDLRYLQPGDPPTEIDALNGTHGVLRPHGGTCDRIGWVIVGGESGHGARPMHPDWARSLRDQCQAAGVPFLFKQWGEWGPDLEGAETCGNCGGTKFDLINSHGECGRCGIEDWRAADKPLDALRRVGKKAAGRQLDGIEHNGIPA